MVVMMMVMMAFYYQGPKIQELQEPDQGKIIEKVDHDS